ncbi:hypothetical protein LXL04_030086 [Taraxacum kok-saghyz]
MEELGEWAGHTYRRGRVGEGQEPKFPSPCSICYRYQLLVAMYQEWGLREYTYNIDIFEQSATFIKGRCILDGPMILNEVMNWYLTKKMKLMVFKVDFEKAYDSLR